MNRTNDGRPQSSRADPQHLESRPKRKRQRSFTRADRSISRPADRSISRPGVMSRRLCYLHALKLVPGSWMCGSPLRAQAASRGTVISRSLPGTAAAPHMTLYMRARALRDLRNYSDAIVASRQAEALSPSDADILNNAGIILQHLGRDGEAMEKFDRATTLRPGFATL
jgi:tetratricopeptide (TPR) repeat protein